MDPAERFLEPLLEAVLDPRFLLLLVGRVADERRLVCIADEARADKPPVVLPDGDHLRGDLDLLLPGDDNIVVAVVFQPEDVLFRRDARVHDDQGLCLEGKGGKGGDHALEGARFAHVPVEDFRPLGEAVGVEHHPQGEQRAVASLLLRHAEAGLVVVLPRTLEEGVREVERG